ncbi:uncharacterized protein JCM15063_000023 [Sporobolomyces koalae]|uniref:uncharacterized protein n=1 Tax=Sporobolomyces koalae TaxID=500713 RepID=UPI0031824B7F
MVNFRFRSLSNASESDKPFTSLPRKGSLRSLRSSVQEDAPSDPSPHRDDDESSLFPRMSGQFEGMAEFGGATYAELLGRGDVRESVLLRAGIRTRSEVEGETGRAEEAIEETVLALPGGAWGVTGSDASLLLQELHRARVSTAQRRRRRISYLAGIVSLVVLGADLWLTVSTVVSLVRYGGRNKGTLRWITLSFYLATLALVLIVIGFLRTRRASILALVAMFSTSLTAFLHISLALTNFVLTFVWKESLVASSVTWKVDVSWARLEGGENTSGKTGFGGWAVAAVVRFFVVTAVAVVWLSAVRRYNRAIHTPYVISPHALPSGELRALLEQHRATIVPLASDAYAVEPEHDPDFLPSHLDRAHYVRASEASAAYSYISSHFRSSTAGSGPGESVNAKSGGVSTWIGAKLWGGIGWMLGVQPYEEQSQLAEKGEDVEVATAGEMVERTRFEMVQASNSASIEPPAQAHRKIEPASSSFLERMQGSSKRMSTGSTAPLLADCSAQEILESVLLESVPYEDVPIRPNGPPKDTYDFQQVSSSGSSGSTGGQIVYVRMADGRLVRRLSTIKSLDLGSEIEDPHTRCRSNEVVGTCATDGSASNSFRNAQS